MEERKSGMEMGRKKEEGKAGEGKFGEGLCGSENSFKRPSSGPSLALTVSSIWLICNVRFLRATAHKCYSVYMYMPRQFRLSVRLSHA